MKLLFSTIGKKIQVALSGIFLMVFLLFHLINNLMLFGGADQFNSMVLFLESIKPLVRIMEFGLLLLLIIHTGNAIKLTFENKKLTFVPMGSSLIKENTKKILSIEEKGEIEKILFISDSSEHFSDYNFSKHKHALNYIFSYQS